MLLILNLGRARDIAPRPAARAHRGKIGISADVTTGGRNRNLGRSCTERVEPGGRRTASGSCRPPSVDLHPARAAMGRPNNVAARQQASSLASGLALALLGIASHNIHCALAKTKWNDPNPNPGWDKYYGGKCAELERCTEAGDLNCLQTSAIPLCNLEVQETHIDKPWQKVLGLAAAHGQLEVVQLFINSPLRWWQMEAPINDSGENVLMHAAAHGEYEIVMWLLEQGADVRIQSDAGETARDLAAASENPARTLGALDKFAAEKTEALVSALRTNSGLREAQMGAMIKGGADLSHVDEETQLTPLGLAVKNGIVEATAKLLENNAPTHHVHPRTGHDIINTACDRGHFHIVDLLISHGADIQATTVQFEMNWCARVFLLLAAAAATSAAAAAAAAMHRE
jgi:hypothetical protein